MRCLSEIKLALKREDMYHETTNCVHSICLYLLDRGREAIRFSVPLPKNSFDNMRKFGKTMKNANYIRNYIQIAFRKWPF